MSKIKTLLLLISGAIVLSLAHQVISLDLDVFNLNLAATGWEVAVIFVISLALVYPVNRSRWHGWKLAAASFFLLAGVNAFLVMYEMLVFTNPQNVAELLTWWVLRAAGVTLLVVPVVNKWQPGRGMFNGDVASGLSPTGLVWRIPAAVATYTALFMAAGLLAIKLQMVPDYIANTPSAAKVVQAQQAPSTPAIEVPEASSVKVPEPRIIFGFISSRGLACILFALPLLRSFPAGRWRAGVAVGLALAVFGGVAPLLAPNADMTDMTRYGHMFEISWSNFVYGLVLGYLFGKPLPTTGSGEALRPRIVKKIPPRTASP
jgi:hypothetical protein